MAKKVSWLRRKEKKELLEKVTEYVGRKLAFMASVEGWTYVEISSVTGVPQNRLSEYVHFEKHERTVTEEHLALFIGGGILSVQEMKEKLDLNEAEANYIHTLTVYENETLRKYALKFQESGTDPGKLLQRLWEEGAEKKKEK